MFELTDKIALVTGARRGMGRADAKALAKQGATVIVTDIDLEECQSVVDEIEKDGGKAKAFKLDVADESNVNEVFDEVVEEYGKLDILVNNAGILIRKSAEELTADEWDQVMNVNLRGQFLCARKAGQIMKEQNTGSIVNIASVSSGGIGVAVPGSAAYTASKGGVIGLTEALAVDYAKFNVRVNAIAPGGINTPMANPEGKSAKELEDLVTRAPMGRIGEPEEIAAAVVFLASEGASYITGATLPVDGGWLAG